MPILSNNSRILSNRDTSGEWRRPEDWLAMPTGITSSDQTFVGLHAIFPEGQNYCAFRFTTSAGQYQVDWGDGTVDLVDSNTNAEHEYNYSTYDTGNTTLSSRGYKQAIITVTPVSGNLLTCNFQQRFVTSPVQNQPYSTGFLDCILSMPNANTGQSIVFGGTTLRQSYIERFTIKTIGNTTNLTNLFTGCISLQLVPVFNTTGITNGMAFMFNNCRSLQTVPLFNTQNVITMQGMFLNCISLQTVPLFNTQNVITMQTMFYNCYSLQTVPLFDTQNVTNMSEMFVNGRITSVPLFNTQNVTNMSQMFNACFFIQSVPLFNTQNVITMQNMFLNCNKLQSIPNLSTSAITTSSGIDFTNTFNGCNSLDRIQMVFSRSVSMTNCQLSRTALIEIFTNLTDRSSTTSATINITGNWGASALTAADRLIATDKNWTITG